MTEEQKQNFIAFENYKFQQKYNYNQYIKWRKDGMWDAIKTGKIKENTEKARTLKG